MLEQQFQASLLGLVESQRSPQRIIGFNSSNSREEKVITKLQLLQNVSDEGGNNPKTSQHPSSFKWRLVRKAIKVNGCTVLFTLFLYN